MLTNDRDGLTHDFSRRDGVEHSEILLPGGVGAEWALDRSALWNATETAENRRDAVMMTTRRVSAEGLGDKTALEREKKWLIANDGCSGSRYRGAWDTLQSD